MAGATEAFTSAGSTVAICLTAPGTETEAGYEALNYEDVGEVVDIPEFGKEYELITHNPLSDRRTRKHKGPYNLGAFVLNMARVPGDAGHQDMITALGDDDPATFRVGLHDGTFMYFRALVMSYKTGIGTVNQITAATSAIEIDSEILEVAP